MAEYNALRGGSNPNVYTDTAYNESGLNPNGKKPVSKWIKIGVPVAIVAVIVAAVLGGVLGSRASNNNSSSSSVAASSQSAEAAASSAASVKAEVGLFATATNSEFMVPIYPSTTNTAAFTTPTFVESSGAQLSWPEDTFKPSNPAPTSVRSDRPRLFAPAFMWAALPNLIANDPYLKAWNDTIFGNATQYYGLPPVVYHMDGSSGILDNSREIKMRIKAFAYVYRMTNDTKWSNRAWAEIQNAAGNGTSSFPSGDDKWNPAHFLDVAEMSSAFGIAYDWFYDAFDDGQKEQLRFSLIQYGLSPGIDAVNGGGNGWWRTNTTGNWNCVCNAGLTVASLAILGDDTTGSASQLLGNTIQNTLDNCVRAVSTDGTWAETANYWYFGTTGHAEMAAALSSATGSDYGLLTNNNDFQKTGDYHMYAYGPTSLFDWGDHGPNKFSSTANTMLFYSKQFNQPSYALFQRDRSDAAEPWSMFWYDPSVVGAYWDGKPLDNFFDNAIDQWVSMRSSWTDQNALYVGMKAGMIDGPTHQNHNDLDVGDFVLDALGTRWAGELGSGDYLATNYFDGQNQDSDRWKYYRKMTEGQNTILIGQTNQLVSATPSIQNSGTTGEKQGSSTVLDLDSSSTAFWITDMTSAYGNATSVKRGVRLLNGRKQVLVQDEINASASIQWRMHTNATVSTDGSTATLQRDGKTMKVSILSPSGASFTTSDAVRFSSDPTPPSPDQDNPGITVLIVPLDAGTQNLQVLFSPQWDDGSSSVTPPSVDLANWSLTSHN